MRFFPLHTAVAVCIPCLLFRVATLGAAPAPPFSDLLMQSETTAPRLLEAAAEIEAAAGHARQSKAWPNPELGVEVEDFAGSGVYHGSSQAQTTLSLSEPLELGGQRSARVQAGRAELTAASARGQRARADFIYDLTLAYAMAEVAQSRAVLLAEDLDRAQEDVRQARALVDAGKEGELRAVQAEAAAAGARADLEAARADALETLGRLSSLVGVKEAFTSIGSSLLVRVSGVAPVPERRALAPGVLVARSEFDSAERRVQVERKQALPKLSLSVGVRRFAGDDTSAMVGGVSVSLPVFDWNRGAIAAAGAERAAAHARLLAADLDAEAGWRTAVAQQAAAEARLTAAGHGEGAAREAYRLARIGYEAGRSPLLELLSTRRALTDAELRSLEARLARVRAEASLARLAGRVPFGGHSE